MSTPQVPVPDTRDWTWVIHEPCPDCGFDPGTVEHHAIPRLTRDHAIAIAQRLDRDDAAVRPAPEVWSALEYGCHVRDVCALFADRLHRMLTEDDPLFANWDQDETALEQRYWAQQPAEVGAELRRNADVIAAAFAAVEGAKWQRPGRRDNGSTFTVDTFARYFLHDLAHHAWDVSGHPAG